MDSLISTQSLAERLVAANCIVLDASKHLPDAGRSAAQEFEEAHIPGARYLDMPNLHDTSAPVTNTMPSASQVASHMAALGVQPSDALVLYDDSAIKSAARAWFILRGYGFVRVAILDGGLGKWRAEGRPLESGSAETERTPRVELTGQPALRSQADLLANISTATELVIDARDAARFGGVDADGGHIPGSCNLWFGALFNEDGTYKNPTELKRLFADAGITADQPVITTCNSGMTAAVLLFALHLIGRDDVALYDGSWQEWGNDHDTPKSLWKAA